MRSGEVHVTQLTGGRISPPGGRRDGRLPSGGLLLLFRAFRIRRLRLLVCALRMLLGLGR